MKVHFYRTQYRRPITEFLKELSSDDRDMVLSRIQVLQQNGINMGPPLVKKVQRNLYELRVRTHTRQIRLFFTKTANICTVLHGYIKKTNKIPEKELRTAIRRLTGAYRI